MKFPEKITIASYTITIVPRYSETDRAGVIHHSVYPVWFEMGRTELLRANGVAYKELESDGIFFVVADLHLKYRRPAFYDQAVNLVTTCAQVTASRAIHTYVIRDKAKGIILTEGESTLACVDPEAKIQRMPSCMFLAALEC